MADYRWQQAAQQLPPMQAIQQQQSYAAQVAAQQAYVEQQRRNYILQVAWQFDMIVWEFWRAVWPYSSWFQTGRSYDAGDIRIVESVENGAFRIHFARGSEDKLTVKSNGVWSFEQHSWGFKTDYGVILLPLGYDDDALDLYAEPPLNEERLSHFRFDNAVNVSTYRQSMFTYLTAFLVINGIPLPS